MENENKTENGLPVEEKAEYKGRNLEEAISLAEHRLKLPREKFNYEIVTEKTRLFGIKSKEIVIRAWAKDEDAETAAERFLERLMTVFPLELTYQVKKRPDIVFIIFDGPDKTILLRNDGSLLLAIQHVLNKISPVKVQVDCEFFRKRKDKKLREYAQRVARQVSDTGQEEVLDLMNPYERRIIHIVANEIPGVTSESIGDGFLKKVKIFRAPADAAGGQTAFLHIIRDTKRGRGVSSEGAAGSVVFESDLQNRS